MRSPFELAAITYRFFERPHVFTRIEELVTTKGHREKRAQSIKKRWIADYRWVATHSESAEKRTHVRRGRSLSAKFGIMNRRLATNS